MVAARRPPSARTVGVVSGQGSVPPAVRCTPLYEPGAIPASGERPTLPTSLRIKTTPQLWLTQEE